MVGKLLVGIAVLVLWVVAVAIPVYFYRINGLAMPSIELLALGGSMIAAALIATKNWLAAFN